MNTGILITARLGSARLKKKHLLPINGKPAISFLIGRINDQFCREINNGEVKVIITTSDEIENREFDQFKDMGGEVFYGSKENIPLRHLQTTEFYSLDNAVSVDGDDILCSVEGMRKVYDALKHGGTYISTCGLPFGMNTMGYSKAFLHQSLIKHANDVLETGWGRIFDANQLVKIMMPSDSNNSLRFTLDYYDDYLFFKALIESAGNEIYTMSDRKIVEQAVKHGFHELNKSVAEEYWRNFNKVKNQEIEMSERSGQEGIER